MLFNTKDSGTLFGAITQSRQAKIDVGAYQRVINDIRLKGTDTDWFAQQLDISQYSHMSDEVKSTLVGIQEELRKTGGDGEKAIEQIEIALDETSAKGTKLGNTIKNVGVSIVNGLASAGISLAISAIISGIVTIADKLFITKKEAEEFTQTFRDGFSTMKTEQSKTISDLQGLEQEFEQLSKGVNTLGQNVSLSDEEFERYHEITSTIAEAMPNLITGYDEQGNAIVRLTDDVRSLSEAYKEARQEQAYNLYNKEDEKGQKIVKGVFKNAREAVKGKYDTDLDVTLNTYKKLAEMTSKEFIDAAKFTEDHFAFSEVNLAQGLIQEAGINNADEVSEDDFKKAHAMLISQYKDYQNEIKMAAKDIREEGITYAEGLTDFWDNLNERQIKAFENYVNTFDYDFLKENDLFEEENMKTYMTNLIDVFDDLSDKDLEQIDLKLNLSTQFNSGEISAAEYYQKLTELNEYLDKIPDGEVKKIISVLFNLSVKDENKIDDRVEHLKKIMGDNWDDKYLDELGEQELEATMKINPKYEMADSFDERGFQKFDQEVYDDKGNKLEVYVEPKIDPYDWDEIQSQISDEINPIKLEPDADDLVSDLKDLESDWSSLQSAYETSVTNGETLSASSLQGVTDAFGGIGADDDGKYNALSSALEEYNKQLVENPGNTKVAQEATDDLATAYLDISGSLEDLIDKDAEYAKEVLKQQGVENAEEVVQSRLNKTYKATRQNLSKLAQTVAEYSDQLSQSDKTAADFNPMSGQFKDITADVANLIGQYDQATGELVSPADIDGQFMADNWGLVEDAIHGVDGAVDELYVKLALVNAENILIEAGLDDSQIDAELGNIQTMLDIASGWTMEPQALLDNSQFMSALKASYDGTQASVDAINAALGTIGMKVQYKTTTKTIRVAKGADKNAHTVYGGENAGKVMTADKIEVDDFEIVATSTGKGNTGVGANIASPSKNNNGGGNPSGGDNSGSDSTNKDNDKLAEETAETYDWIAVAIQRLDEEIARLDKQVNNTFKTWTKRNTTLRDEIQKVTDEIEAQKLAVTEYERNANLVSGSGQQLTNKQASKIASAKEAWNEQLQQAIVNGDYTKKKKTTKTVTDKKGNKKKKTTTKNVLDTDKLKGALGDAYNSYIKDAAQELFNDVQADLKKEADEAKKNDKKNKNKNKNKKKNKGKSKGSSKTKPNKTYDFSKYIVGDSNKPKKSDYDGNTKQYKADLKAWKEAQNQWATGTYQQKIREGTMTGTDIEQIKNKYLKEAINLYKEEYQKVVDVGDAIEDNKIKISEEYKELFDNIAKEYDELIDKIQSYSDITDKRVDRVKEMGYFVDQRLYEENIKYWDQIVSKRETELNAQIDQFNEGVKKGALEPYSEAWYEEFSALQATNAELVEARNNVVKYNQEIKKGQWERVSFLNEQLQQFKEEGDWIRELLSYKDMYDENGRYNDRGWASSAIIDEEYRYAQENVKRYEQLMKDFREGKNEFKGHAYDPYSQDDINEMKELNDGYKENVSLLKEMAEANKELVQNGINKHLESLKELIDKYNESLSAAKDLYDFEKNISNQTSNINSLQRQLQAYGGDDSEEGRKRRQELRKQLQDAEQQLQETEWDRYISQTNKMLDNLYGDYEEFLNARLEDIIVLMQDQQVANNGQKDAISNGLKETQDAFSADFKNYGNLVDNKFDTIQSAFKGTFDSMTAAIKEITNPTDKSSPLYQLLKDEQDVIENVNGTVALKTTDITAELEKARLEDDLNKQREKNGGLTDAELAAKQAEEARQKAEAEAAAAAAAAAATTPAYDGITTTTVAQVNDQDYMQDLATMVGNVFGNTDYAGNTYDYYKSGAKLSSDGVNWQYKGSDGKWHKFTSDLNQFIASETNGKYLTNAGIQKLYEYTGTNNVDDLLTFLLNLSQKYNIANTKAFATGSRYIPKKQLAWTQEEGSELIFRSSDGAMLTPLNQGDMVFTNEMSQRLWEIASGDVPSTIGGLKLPDISGNVQTNITANNEITISLPNVNDYESFKNELQNDTRFEKFIQEVTIGQALGNNTLNKRKY